MFRKQRSNQLGLLDTGGGCGGDSSGGRPRSRTLEKLSSRLSLLSLDKSSSHLEIGRPMNFKHEVNVRKESDGTFSGMPDEWLTLMLKQVVADRENGDHEAAEAGARVLRFFQEFSRDGSRKTKFVKKKPPPNAAALSMKKKMPPMPRSPKGSTFYLELDSEVPNNHVRELNSPAEEVVGEEDGGESEDVEPFQYIQLTDAQQAMANAILELRTTFGETPKKIKPSKPARVTNNSSRVQFRTSSPSPGQASNPTTNPAAYRNISLYTSAQALGELRRLCNSSPMDSVFDLGRKLGSGSGGTVWLGKRKSNGEKAALKAIDLTTGERKAHLLMEVVVMRELRHKNLVVFKDIFMNEKELWVAMEHMDAGALTDVVLCTILSEPLVATVCREVLQGIEYLHQQEVVHRDIKSDNVLLSMRGDVKITDFGFAANVADNRMRKTFAGTPYWMAPEIINKSTYSTKVDVWSTGILAVEMLDGSPPYMSETPMKAMYLISKRAKPQIKTTEISADLRDFLDRCLTVEVAERATATDLLAHNFVTQRSGPTAALVPHIKATKQRKNGLI